MEDMSMRGKKKYILVIVMVIALFVLGCTDSDSNQNEESYDNRQNEEDALVGDEEIVLRFAWWGSETRHQAMREVVALFEAANPNVTIIMEYGPWDGYGGRLLTELSGGVEPDIMQVNYNWIHSYGQGSNVFHDLNQLSDHLDLSNWDQIYLDAMSTYDGQLGAVPWGMTGRVPLMNIQVFEEFELEFPTTYEEAIAIAQIIGRYNQNNGHENRYTFMSIGNESRDLFIAQMLLNLTGEVMQTNGQVNYTVEQVVEVFELFQQMEEAGVMPTFHQEDPIQNESNPVWVTGRTGGIYEWTSSLDKYIESFLDGEGRQYLAIGNFLGINPEDEQVIYVKPNLGYGISRNSSHPEMAARFIDFLFTNEEAVAAMNTQLGLSSNKVTRGFQRNLGLLYGITEEAIELLDSHQQIVMDPFFEDRNIRNERFMAIEGFRTGSMDLHTAARLYIYRQQGALDELFGR
jgi:oligogalacturonide transport system substrate-binding protein